MTAKQQGCECIYPCGLRLDSQQNGAQLIQALAFEISLSVCGDFYRVACFCLCRCMRGEEVVKGVHVGDKDVFSSCQSVFGSDEREIFNMS